MDDFGYDVADYCGIDPIFGDFADFDRIIEKAHGLGLKVIIDQVYSHTSDQHARFQESRADCSNPKADWYVWADAKADGSPPSNWQSVFGGRSEEHTSELLSLMPISYAVSCLKKKKTTMTLTHTIQ